MKKENIFTMFAFHLRRQSKIKNKNRLKLFLLGLFILVVVDVLAVLAFQKSAEVAIPFSDSPESSDGIIVFHGDRSGNGQDIGPGSIARMQMAEKLLQDDKGKGIFCTGGARPEIGYFGCVLMREHLVAVGLNQDKIFADTRSNDTISNIHEALMAASFHEWKSMTLVSDQMHLIRIKVLLDKFPDKPKIIFAPVNGNMFAGVGKFFQIWKRAHYELLAWIAWKLIPTDVYRFLLDKIRGRYVPMN